MDRTAALASSGTGAVGPSPAHMTGRSPLPLRRAGFVELDGMYRRWDAAPAADARLAVLNEPLASELGLDVDALRSPAGVAALTGHGLGGDVVTVAQAYAGHQFGGFSSSLGDGRALLLGEVADRTGRWLDVHLKGSGPTPYARGGDGRAALGPMLREYVIAEAMHALGVPTTRALAVVTTGDRVVRERDLPGAILVRVASTHLRVGSFQYAATHGDVELLRRLADHAIARLRPDAAGSDQRYVALFESVVEVQAALVAHWMLVGFVHGVMNTDNTTISGETIDYGPCAFMDAYDPATVFSSIDHGGRYAYGNQPRIVHWNLARLGEALLGLFAAELDPAVDVANAVLATFAGRYEQHWLAGMRAKLGLVGSQDGDGVLAGDLLDLLSRQRVDLTSAFRSLSTAVAGDQGPIRALFVEASEIDAWAARWQQRRQGDDRAAASVAAAMNRVNALYIPRNHLVEGALDVATAGDLAAFEQLVHVVTRPFEARDAGPPDADIYRHPAPPGDGPFRTFCGT